MTPRIDEVAPDLYRISLYAPQFDLQFNHFLVRDDEPLLFHTGMRGMFPAVRDAVATLIDPAALRWISWSHFEVDECGALNEWLAAAPNATPVCGELGAMINIGDFSNRPPRGLKPDEVLETGTAPVPLRADAAPAARLGRRHAVRGNATACCCARTCCTRSATSSRSRPATSSAVTGDALETYQQSPVLMDYVPYTENTKRHLATLASLQPRIARGDARVDVRRRRRGRAHRQRRCHSRSRQRIAGGAVALSRREDGVEEGAEGSVRLTAVLHPEAEQNHPAGSDGSGDDGRTPGDR